MDLRVRFESLWNRIGGRGDPAPIFDDLIARYREPHRRYHTEDHLHFGLAQLDLIADEPDDAQAVECAFFFHDAVYDTAASDSEARSAELASATLGQASVAQRFVVETAKCIMATAASSTPDSANERVISDVDLAILGQPRTAFMEYERLVREEYATVPDHAFWRARKAILRGFLDRPGIYSTGRFRALYEQEARQNIDWTLARH